MSAAAMPQPPADPGSTTHNATPTGECACCLSDLDNTNYVEYQKTATNPLWFPSKYCDVCLQVIIDSQFTQFKEKITHPTCKAEHRRLIARGPPQFVSDRLALPNDESKNEKGNITGEVASLWFAKDNAVRTGALKDALTGEARMTYWREQEALFIDGPDDDEPTTTATAATATAATGTATATAAATKPVTATTTTATTAGAGTAAAATTATAGAVAAAAKK